MTDEAKTENNYWDRIFMRLERHNRESKRSALQFSEYKEQLEKIFEGCNAIFNVHESNIEVDCILEDDYRLSVDVSESQSFIRFINTLTEGNLCTTYLSETSLSKPPFWEINDFVHNFEGYKSELKDELAKLQRKDKVNVLIMEMIKSYLKKVFEDTKDVIWKVHFEDELYKVDILRWNEGERKSFSFSAENWRTEIGKKIK